MSTKSVTFLQFNTWLMEVLGVYRTRDFKERLRLIPEYLAKENADVICLLEVWQNRDKLVMAESLKRLGYPYARFTRDPCWSMGDGLLLISKYPITEVEISKPFARPTRLRETFSKKRVMKAVIEVPGIGRVAVCQMHLGAALFDPRTMLYDQKTRKILASQVHEVAEFIREKCGDEKYLFVAGDLNFHYQEYLGSRRHGNSPTEEYSKLLGCFRREDLFLKNSFLEANQLTEKDPHVATFSQSNPYVCGSESDGYPEETLDYILYRPAAGLQIQESKVVFQAPLPATSAAALSDHYGVKSTFVFSEVNAGKAIPEPLRSVK